MTIRILIADDHAVVRDGLREMMRHSPGIEIAAEASSGTEALYLARTHDFDLLLLDISLPGCSGVKVLQELRTSGSRLPVLFFTMHPAEQYASFLHQAGAQGFLGKDADTASILGAIRRILEGGTHFPTLRRPVGRTRTETAFDALSEREREVMTGLLDGRSQVEIAANLGITNKSVGTYRRRLLTKLGLDNNAELIALATRLERPR
jgi:DNA-binding NarL/FixJ family response regulator